MREPKCILEFDRVSFTYPEERQKALEDISFRLHDAEFAVLCGQSGCGKTTLLRHIKKNQTPFGERTGHIRFLGEDLDRITERRSAAAIGFVGQNPDSQIVTDKVWHELAFGLENLGVKSGEIRRRVGEIAEYFGIGGWFHKTVQELSGGQKQIVSLASVMVMQPELLVLDEPTAQLDPIGAERFIHTLVKLNQDFGTTILLSEQRLEEVLPVADRIIVMQEGRLAGSVPVRECAELLLQEEERLGYPLAVAEAMPAAVRIYMAAGKDGRNSSYKQLPLTVREGREWLRQYAAANRHTENPAVPVPAEGSLSDCRRHSEKEPCGNAGRKQKKDVNGAGRWCWPRSREHKEEPAVRAVNLSYAYGQKRRPPKGKEHGRTGSAAENDRKVLNRFHLEADRGCIYALLGGNGSGKTTALKLLAGIYQPDSGRVYCEGRTAYLPQNPMSLFTEITVEEELLETEEWADSPGTGNEAWEKARSRAEELLVWLELAECRHRNPYDLSGGQQQRLAFGKLLMSEPDVLFLDEPTKGMDAAFKKKLSAMLKDLCRKGKTIVLVSHDVEFCAEYADFCGLLFDGQIINSSPVRAFFQSNTFYTTAAGRIGRGILDDCIVVGDILREMEGWSCS